jgi:hypothetical protein
MPSLTPLFFFHKGYLGSPEYGKHAYQTACGRFMIYRDKLHKSSPWLNEAKLRTQYADSAYWQLWVLKNALKAHFKTRKEALKVLGEQLQADSLMEAHAPSKLSFLREAS